MDVNLLQVSIDEFSIKNTHSKFIYVCRYVDYTNFVEKTEQHEKKGINNDGAEDDEWLLLYSY